MTKPPLSQHQKTLEDLTFADRDEGLLAYLQSSMKEKEVRDQLAAVSGIEDSNVLNSLVKIGISTESLAALTLIPLVQVAWADDQLSQNEQEAILNAAKESGITLDSPAYPLLESWLMARPSGDTFEAWRNYAQALTRELDDAALSAVKLATLGRAQEVAKAAGGLLGMGNRVSEREQLVLSDLARAFDKPSELA